MPSMLWRNMAAMAMEEMFLASPIDDVVLPGGAMLSGHFRGEALGMTIPGFAGTPAAVGGGGNTSPA